MKLMRFVAVGVLCMAIITKARAEEYEISSPNNKMSIELHVERGLSFSVKYNDEVIINNSEIRMILGDETVLGNQPVVEQVENREVDETLYPILAKNKSIPENYREITVHLSKSYAVVLRAYDEGVAYRFVTAIDGEMIVKSETATFNLAGSGKSVFPTADNEMRSWERAYETFPSLSGIPDGKFCVTPALFKVEKTNVVIAESDLFDYPGMYLVPDGDNQLQGKWAQCAKAVSDPENVYAYHRVVDREDYLAKTNGSREFPWRVIIATDTDKELLNNELIYKLASPSILEDTSWIKPGKSAWEWWHDAILETDQVESGPQNLSFDLYKYYVDFAAEYKLEYVTMDAGWGADYAANVCNYAASKNVKVIMWDFINLPIENPDRLTQIKNMGAAGVKVDLIERDDQEAINWLQQLAEECAKRKLMLILHGCPKPTGLQRTYPNIVNIEAVRGAECAKWDRTPNPDYHTQFPFIRMLAGPLDYTPGSMRNVHADEFQPVPHGIPMTMGTKAHELAMYVIFDQPLAYLCDSPIEYRKNQIAMNFLKKVPTTWDKTVALDGKVGEFITMARKKGEDWFVGGMTDTKSRTLSVDFSFLDDQFTYDVEIYSDNAQTTTDAKVLAYEVKQVNNQSVLNFDLAKDGGFVIYLKKAETTSSVDPHWIDPFRFYYNQGNQYLNVETKESIRKIGIYDLLGKNKFVQVFPTQTQRAQLDVSGLVPGVYVASVYTEKQKYVRKFLK